MKRNLFSQVMAVVMLVLFALLVFCGPAAAAETKYSDTISQVVALGTNAQSLASQASTMTKVTFATEIVDSRTEFAANKFTAKSPGLYMTGGNVKFAASTDNASRDVIVYLNGAATRIANSTCNTDGSGTRATIVNACGLIKLAAGDYLELFARQTSGSAIVLDNSTEFFVTKIH